MRSDARFSEDSRQSVHIAMGGFALLLPLIPWWQSIVLAAFTVLFNLFGLQRLLGRRLFRPGERIGRFTSGIVLYPLTVLLLLLVFGGRLDIVAAAWGIFAAGDGMATIVGRRAPIARIPWNRQKSLGGTLAFALCGAAAGIGLAWWCRDTVMPPAYTWFFFVAPVLAAFVAAAVETIPISLDDNVSVPASAAGVMWVVSLVSIDLIDAFVRAGASRLFTAAGANVVVALAGYAAATVTLAGMIAGAVLGTAIFLFTGPAGWALLLLCFAVAVVTSRMGLARKRALGIAEERGGRRGAGNAIANTGVAAIAATMSALTYAEADARLAFVAALVAGASDTVASEIGKAWGQRTFLVTTARRVPPGTSGAMSLEGTAAGVVSAALLGGAACGLGIIAWEMLLYVVAAATAGALVESALGATLEHRGVLNNDVLNFINTGVAVFVAVELWQLR
ncbi:MAG TPA: DUF92 domain-containing protein [Vicinamibacterales bacterium]|nr:DUF92 domain-containing protein [Vicinamibacterales bacterium]